MSVMRERIFAVISATFSPKGAIMDQAVGLPSLNGCFMVVYSLLEIT
jgi:hypothetical protein